MEEVGESSSPPRAAAAPHLFDVRDDVYRRLVENGNDAASDPGFREQLDAHFSRLPPRYAVLEFVKLIQFSISITVFKSIMRVFWSM